MTDVSLEALFPMFDAEEPLGAADQLVPIAAGIMLTVQRKEHRHIADGYCTRCGRLVVSMIAADARVWVYSAGGRFAGPADHLSHQESLVDTMDKTIKTLEDRGSHEAVQRIAGQRETAARNLEHLEESRSPARHSERAWPLEVAERIGSVLALCPKCQRWEEVAVRDGKLEPSNTVRIVAKNGRGMR